MIDQDKMDVILRRVDEANLNDTSVRNHEYVRDVRLLLAEVELVRRRAAEDDEAHAKCVNELFAESTKKLHLVEEQRNLWKRDCEAAQLRIAELERQREGRPPELRHAVTGDEAL